MEEKIREIIKYYFKKSINSFMEEGTIKAKHSEQCHRELMNIIKKIKAPVQEKSINVTKTTRYELSSNQQGLYLNTKENTDSSCYVVAGGESLKGFDFSLLKNKTTIVSNKSIFDVPNADYFITTDYTFLNWTKKHNLYEKWKSLKCQKIFVANCISDFIKIENGTIIDTRCKLVYELQDFDQIIICKSAKSIGYDFENFNSGYNSGFCSFQLAIILGFENIRLLGMDMVSSKGKTHYHGGYNKCPKKMNQNLNNYSIHFLKVLNRLKIEKPDLKIISCSPISILNEKIKYKEIREIL